MNEAFSSQHGLLNEKRKELEYLKTQLFDPYGQIDLRKKIGELEEEIRVFENILLNEIISKANEVNPVNQVGDSEANSVKDEILGELFFIKQKSLNKLIDESLESGQLMVVDSNYKGLPSHLQALLATNKESYFIGNKAEQIAFAMEDVAKEAGIEVISYQEDLISADLDDSKSPAQNKKRTFLSYLLPASYRKPFNPASVTIRDVEEIRELFKQKPNDYQVVSQAFGESQEGMLEFANRGRSYANKILQKKEEGLTLSQSNYDDAPSAIINPKSSKKLSRASQEFSIL